MTNQINHTTIQYSADNFLDIQIMEALANVMHVNSGVSPNKLLEVLESMPTNIALKKQAA